MLLFIFRLSSSPNPDDIMKENKHYIRERKPITFDMNDLEQHKDLEDDDEFKTTAKPSTSRTMYDRTCNKNVIYQYDMNGSYLHEDTDDSDEAFDEESDGYSSPNIDYAQL